MALGESDERRVRTKGVPFSVETEEGWRRVRGAAACCRWRGIAEGWRGRGEIAARGRRDCGLLAGIAHRCGLESGGVRWLIGFLGTSRSSLSI